MGLFLFVASDYECVCIYMSFCPCRRIKSERIALLWHKIMHTNCCWYDTYYYLSYYTYHRMISFCMAINCRNILERWSFCTVDMMREKNMRTMAQYAVIIPHPSYYSGSSLVSISVSVDWHSYFRYKCELSHLARSSKKMASNLLIIEISVAHNNVDCGERPLL